MLLFISSIFLLFLPEVATVSSCPLCGKMLTGYLFQHCPYHHYPSSRLPHCRNSARFPVVNLALFLEVSQLGWFRVQLTVTKSCGRLPPSICILSCKYFPKK